MYIAYGWPQVIPVESDLSPTSERIVYVKVSKALLLIVCKSHIELWSSSQHKVRLGKYKRDSGSLQREGENIKAIWSLDTKLIAVITSSLFLHIFKVHFTERRIQIGGNPSGLFLSTISLLMGERMPHVPKSTSRSNLVCDSKHFLVGLSDGSFYVTSWKGEFCGPFVPDVDGITNPRAIKFRNSLRNGHTLGCALHCADPGCAHPSITQMELSLQLKLLFVVYCDGQLIQFLISKKGLRSVEEIKEQRKLGSGDSVCASVASEQRILAVGTRRGTVELYSLGDSVSLFRIISLNDWGYSVGDTGPVSSIAWTPDNSAFAVGWSRQGLTVWSVSGCRMMSTFPQISLSVSSPAARKHEDCKRQPLVDGTSLIAWDEYGYCLFAIERCPSKRIISFSFAKCCLDRGIMNSAHVRQLMHGADRLLIVEDMSELKILHLNLPVSYLSQNWPVRHVSASEDGTFIAVSGIHGLILYDVRLRKCRMFGDITQEQKICCEGLLWLGKIVIICNSIASCNSYELLFYPRYHLDQSSLLYRKPLMAKPMVMDTYKNYILVAYHPFDVHIFHVIVSGDLCPSGSPTVKLSTVRELSIMCVKPNPVSMRIIPNELATQFNSGKLASSFSGAPPTRCVILRGNGDMSLLELDDGREHSLTDAVELFWLTRCSDFEDKTNLLEEVSWLDYGNRGMRVWYRSAGADPFEQQDFLQLDPELEFDREVYPLGVLPNAGVVIGVLQRLSFSTSTEFPCFEPTPRARTILHCLLRHLLQRDKAEEALKFARLSAGKPHFSQCLEWLLFTVFDAVISRHCEECFSRSLEYCPCLFLNGRQHDFRLLGKTCGLIRNFAEYHDVVVSVARKTDGRHWADLFSIAGRSTELFEECLQRRWYRTGACYILVIARLEGPEVGQHCAIRLLQAAVDESFYDLAGELVSFLLRSGKEFYGAWREAPQRCPDGSVCGVSVKNILESHARHLMTGKELSKLVSFVKGTGFDLAEYLRREMHRSARLDGFASELDSVRRKFRVERLQCRLDAEFLLAHVCSVKFKEWIVILATLLHRSEVLFDLFRHDARLWRAYSSALRSQSAFGGEYDCLLDDLAARLTLTGTENESA